MRVHRLEMTAFGPFPGTEVVDFGPLNTAGVFLLTGQTGAGKTSILDAICFGLYGQVPGVRDKAKSYRSDHAAADRTPRVVLDVTLQGRRLRITRQPPWSRPSRRARAGHVDEKARASVEELLDGQWVARSSRADEVGHLVTGLLGLNRDQFCQVVMLAQGEFQTFLRAGGRDRQQVLESLFGTQRFQAVERWLVEHRRTVSRRYQEDADRLDNVVARLHEVCSPVHDREVFGLPDGPDDAGEVLTAARLAAAAGQEVVDQAAAGLDDLMSAAKRAQHAYDEERSRDDLRRRHAEAIRRHDELDAAGDLVARRETRVRLARAADGLQPLVNLTTDADTVVARAAAALATAREAAATSVPSPEARTVDVEDLQARLSGLAELLKVEHMCDELTTTVETETAVRDSLAAQLESLTAVAIGLPVQIAELRERLADEAEIVARGTGTESQSVVAGEVLAAAREVARLDTARQRLQERRLEAKEAELAVTEVWLDARKRLLVSIAAELAGELVDGRGCPVCGSASHPLPAAPAPAHVGSHEEGDLFERVTAAQVAVATIDRRIEASWLARAEAVVLSNGLGVAQAQGLVDDATARREAAVVAAGGHERLQAELDALLLAAGEQQSLLESTATDVTRIDERLVGVQRQLAAGRERLAADIEPGTRVVTHLEQTRHHLELRRLVDAAEQQHQQALRAAADAGVRLAAALCGTAFADPAAVLAAALPQTEAANLEALNRAHAGEMQACLRDLRDPVLVAAAGDAPADVDALAEAAATAQDAVGRARSIASAVHRRQVRLEELAGELEIGVAELGPLRAAKELADGVAGICCGSSPDNATRTALSHYVLSARLAQVVAAANARLDGICSGRYQLKHTMVRGAGDTRGGLGLVVDDTYTDRTRDPATLSGGETFYVSLSLALGLADVVTAEVGGAEIATLFVDEGFGGLDDETREEVLDELDELRSGGRTIGLVSHLSELRARIPTQIQVRAGPRGSTCRAVGWPSSD